MSHITQSPFHPDYWRDTPTEVLRVKAIELQDRHMAMPANHDEILAIANAVVHELIRRNAVDA